MPKKTIINPNQLSLFDWEEIAKTVQAIEDKKVDDTSILNHLEPADVTKIEQETGRTIGEPEDSAVEAPTIEEPTVEQAEPIVEQILVEQATINDTTIDTGSVLQNANLSNSTVMPSNTDDFELGNTTITEQRIANGLSNEEIVNVGRHIYGNEWRRNSGRVSIVDFDSENVDIDNLINIKLKDIWVLKPEEYKDRGYDAYSYKLIEEFYKNVAASPANLLKLKFAKNETVHKLFSAFAYTYLIEETKKLFENHVYDFSKNEDRIQLAKDILFDSNINMFYTKGAFAGLDAQGKECQELAADKIVNLLDKAHKVIHNKYPNVDLSYMQDRDYVALMLPRLLNFPDAVLMKNKSNRTNLCYFLADDMSAFQMKMGIHREIDWDGSVPENKNKAEPEPEQEVKVNKLNPIERIQKVISDISSYKMKSAHNLNINLAGKSLVKDGNELKTISRNGYDYIGDKTISSEVFAETFGFSSVQFGDWVNEGGKKGLERQFILNMAYESFVDMAKFYNIPTNKIALKSGENAIDSLGLTFGSHGVAKYPAYFEAKQNYIQLNKKKSNGSLAHEWTHAFDYYLQKQFLAQPDLNILIKDTEMKSMFSENVAKMFKEKVDLEKQGALDNLLSNHGARITMRYKLVLEQIENFKKINEPMVLLVEKLETNRTVESSLNNKDLFTPGKEISLKENTYQAFKDTIKMEKDLLKIVNDFLPYLSLPKEDLDSSMSLLRGLTQSINRYAVNSVTTHIFEEAKIQDIFHKIKEDDTYLLKLAEKIENRYNDLVLNNEQQQEIYKKVVDNYVNNFKELISSNPEHINKMADSIWGRYDEDDLDFRPIKRGIQNKQLPLSDIESSISFVKYSSKNDDLKELSDKIRDWGFEVSIDTLIENINSSELNPTIKKNLDRTVYNNHIKIYEIGAKIVDNMLTYALAQRIVKDNPDIKIIEEKSSNLKSVSQILDTKNKEKYWSLTSEMIARSSESALSLDILNSYLIENVNIYKQSIYPQEEELLECGNLLKQAVKVAIPENFNLNLSKLPYIKNQYSEDKIVEPAKETQNKMAYKP